MAVLTVLASAGFSKILFRLLSGMSNLSILFPACRSVPRAGSASDVSTCEPGGLREMEPEVADTAVATSSPFPDWISIVEEKPNLPSNHLCSLQTWCPEGKSIVWGESERKWWEWDAEVDWEALWAVDRKRRGKSSQKSFFFFFFFFPLSLNCNRSDTQKKPSWELAQTSADICLTTFDTAGWRVKTSLCPNGYVWRIKKTCEEYRFESFRKQINSKTSPVPHPPILPLKPEQIKEGTFTAAATVLPGRRDGGHLCYFPALSLGGEEKTTRLSLRWTPIMVKRMITPTTGCWTMLTRMRIPLLLLSWAEKDKHRSNNKRESWADLTGEVR